MALWLEIRDAYEKGGETIAAICERYSISTSTLYNRRKTEKWNSRKADKKSLTAKAPNNQQAKSRRKRKTNKINRTQLIDRLYNAFEKQMSDFENQHGLMADERINEKDARTLGSLARTLEKLIELKNEEEGDKHPDSGDVNIERLREKLAQRLERLHSKRRTE